MHRRNTKTLLIVLTTISVLSTRRVLAAEESAVEPVYQHAVVAADHPLASAAGVEMLKKGGNVIDAAVATSFALSVVRPSSCGIGGGGFLVFYDAKQRKSFAYDYREMAPAKSHPDMFVDALANNAAVPFPSRNGGLAVGVPGTVAGLLTVHELYGKLDRKTVLAPAIRYAAEGVEVDEHMRSVQRAMLQRFEENPTWKVRFRPLYDLYLNKGEIWSKDARFFSPQLTVLKRIAENGLQGFYLGKTAVQLSQTVQTAGGILSEDDLSKYTPKLRKPLRGHFGQAEVHTMPPPSSGGIALLETLNLLSAAAKLNKTELDQLKHNSPEYLHLLTESMKHAYADRAAYLGDPDFVDVPTQTLISSKYAAELARRISTDQTYPPSHYGRFWLRDDSGTSHFSVMDAEGNAVACTETVNTYFGSMVVDPALGVVFNNEMDDFTAIPGQPNAFGLIQSKSNSPEPGKRPLSSMSPTILVRDGKASLALGASGGPRIISTTLQVLLNVENFGLAPMAAVRQPRVHHQWLPDVLYAEAPLMTEIQAPMKERGHVVERRSALAICQVAQRKKDGLRGASDPRKHGKAAGY
ncbi:gamma-glutamyltransferase [Thalassoroseus pseudoceratinae]|uniref:gamma-glutamyltransferase n=1 Tax=Thalassoroseus pseudoceratinae TaxID=2713176 RepID=UPI00142183DB|nr:gamma-glutamyltransferase [Thalassoroseus pseudoceratinae]